MWRCDSVEDAGGGLQVGKIKRLSILELTRMMNGMGLCQAFHFLRFEKWLIPLPFRFDHTSDQ